MFLWSVFSFVLFTAVLGCPTFPQGLNNGLLQIHFPGNQQDFDPNSVYSLQVESKIEMETLVASSEGGGTIIPSNPIDCLETSIIKFPPNGKHMTLMWIPPAKGCVKIRAAAKNKRNSEWEISNTTTICAIQEAEPTEKKCCACDHAKYKLTFEGLWSPKTHPKDFPSISWMTHFSDIIGATHSDDFTMWEEKKFSTYGMQQMAEYGIVRELENELRNQSKKLKTIVHAAGLWYPDVNSKTTTLFKVDPRKHLLSIASMFGPSPDWFVGLNKYDLCLPNCTWRENAVIDLYPYDAGTDSGISYMSPNVPTDPPERIQKITTMFPEDSRSPFYDPVENKMESFARVTITRQNLYPKKCTDLTEEEILQEVSETENTEIEVRPECEVGPYSEWSSCSVSCGKGIRQRSREYLNPDKAKISLCDRQLVSKEMCAAPVPKCPGESEEEEITPLGFGSTCDVTPWNDWSECTVSCGIGMKFRTRELVSNENSTIKKCMHISRMEKQKCMEPPCHSQEQRVPRACSVAEWSEWSPCSVSCGEGYRKRIRHFQAENVPKFCHSSVNLTQSLKCKTPQKCEIGTDEAQKICLLDIFAGPCRGAFKRWAFDRSSKSCKEFYYGGCRGNKNNFEYFEKCNQTCGTVEVKEETTAESFEKVDCVVGKWSNWSPCIPCENGTKTKTRTILKYPKNGGQRCPTLQKTVSCKVPEEFCVTR